MAQSDEDLRTLGTTPSGLPSFAPDLSDVSRRSRRRRVVRGIVLAVAAIAVVGTLAVPLWALRGLGEGDVAPGSGSVRVIRVPDHDFLRSKPYDGTPLIDHVLPEDNFLVAPKAPIASGVVRQVAWTLSAFQTTAAADAGDPPISCGEVTPQDTQSDGPLGGGGYVCAEGGSSASVPEDRALYIGGPGYAYDLPDRLPELVTVVGATRSDVERVEIRMADGRVDSPKLVSGPEPIEWRFFVSYPPPFINGTIIAYNAQGQVIARQALSGCSHELYRDEPLGPIFVNADVVETGCPPLPT